MKKFLLLIFLSLLGLIFLAAEERVAGGDAAEGSPPLIPRRVLFGNPVNAAPRISPDGTKIAYLAPSDKGVMNVWARPLDGGEAKQITQEPVRGIKTYFWTVDARGILYLQDTNGDENFHVLLTDLNNRTTRDLTPFRGVRAVNLIPRDREILVGLNIRNRSLFDMYRIDQATGSVRLDTENPGDIPYLTGNEWSADPSGVIRVIRTLDFRDGSAVLRVRDGRDQSWRELTRWTNGGILDGDVVGFDADGSSLYVTSSSGQDTAGLVRIDTRTGREIQVVHRDARCDLFVEDVMLHSASRTVQALVVNYATREWKVLDSGIARDFEILGKAAKGFFRVVSRDAADAKWIVAYEPEDGPVSSYVYDRKTGNLSFLFDDRPEFRKYVLAPMQPVTISARDGLPLISYLTLPVGVDPKNLPLVLYVHGGPTARDDQGFEPIVQLFANRGYAVLQVNFRGSVGFGNAFQRAGDRQIGVGAMQNDLTDAVRWAVKKGIANSKRVGIFGGSYGGYAVLAGLAFTPELFACGAEGCGPSHIKSLLEAIPAYYGPIKDLFVRIFGDAEKDDAWDRKVSPFFHVDKIRGPLLIVQGANDPRCPIRESDQIVQAIRERGLPVTYVVYTDEGHGFVRPENKLDFYGRLEEFLAAHLGGRFEPRTSVGGSSAEVR